MASRYADHVSTAAVVSCPATSMVIRSSRSCRIGVRVGVRVRV